MTRYLKKLFGITLLIFCNFSAYAFDQIACFNAIKNNDKPLVRVYAFATSSLEEFDSVQRRNVSVIRMRNEIPMSDFSNYLDKASQRETYQLVITSLERMTDQFESLRDLAIIGQRSAVSQDVNNVIGLTVNKRYAYMAANAGMIPKLQNILRDSSLISATGTIDSETSRILEVFKSCAK